MNLATGLLALLLLGSDGPGGPVQQGLRYDVRILEMPGVAWRGTLHEALEPISHQGRVIAWTMPREYSAKLTGAASNQIEVPHLTSLENTSTVLQVGHSQPFVSHLTRIADGPVGQARALALKPTVEGAENSLKVQVQGRHLDQGVLARVEIVDRRIDRMLSYSYKEQVQGTNGPVTLCSTAEVPEVSSSSVEGEWLIPSEGVLVVSLGLQTRADKAGKAETVERLALVDVRVPDRAPVAVRALPEGLPPLPIAASTLSHRNGQGHPVKVAGIAIKPIEPILPAPMLPAPPPPSRGLPTAINHKGEIVETDVPDEEPMFDPDESSEPRPAPQSRVKPNPMPRPPAPDQNAFRADGPNHTEPFLEDYYRALMSTPPATGSKVSKPSIRVEPRINFEIHLSVPELSIASLPNPGEVLSHLGELSAMAPLMEQAATAYLASDEKHDGAFCVFDMEFPLGKSVKSRVSVLVEKEPGPEAKKDDSATPVHFEPFKATCPASRDHKTTPVDRPCPALKPNDQTSTTPAHGPEIRSLTLREAIRMGLQQTHGLSILEAGSMSSPTVIAAAENQTPERLKGDLLRQVRSIEEQYWALASAQAGFRVSEELLSLARKVVERHRNSWSRTDQIEVTEALCRFEIQREEYYNAWKQTELAMRRCPRHSRIVPFSGSGFSPLDPEDHTRLRGKPEGHARLESPDPGPFLGRGHSNQPQTGTRWMMAINSTRNCVRTSHIS